MMKRLSILLSMLLLAGTLSAQNPTSYFMEGSVSRLQWNPAFAPDRGYFAIPFAGNIQLNTNGNLVLGDFLFPQNGELVTLLSSSISAQRALGGFEEVNDLGLTSRIGILNFGRYTKNRKNFWSIDLNLRVDADTQLPYELFEFAKLANSTTFGGVQLGVESTIEAAFNYSFRITDKLYLGARIRGLIGLARVRASIDNFSANFAEDRWTADVDGSVELFGLIPPTTRNEAGEEIYSINKFAEMDLSKKLESLRMPAGYGVGLDLGATYDLLPQLQFSASVTDLGAMFWKKSSAAFARLECDGLEYTGVDIDQEGNVTQPEFDFEKLADDLSSPKVTEVEGRTVRLNTAVNVGVDYSFLKRRIGVGLFYNVTFREYYTAHNLTASANFRPLKWLHLSGSYSLLNAKNSAMGLGLNFCTDAVNLFVGTDILFARKTPQFIPYQQSQMYMNFGLSIVFGKRGERR